jgi:hypothetical protein
MKSSLKSNLHFSGGRTLPPYPHYSRGATLPGSANPNPNGFHGRHEAVASLWLVGGKLRWLDYIAARKHIYCGEYRRLAPLTPHFARLRSLLLAGENLQIVEVDGPDPSLEYGPYARISADAPGMLNADGRGDHSLLDQRHEEAIWTRLRHCCALARRRCVAPPRR